MKKYFVVLGLIACINSYASNCLSLLQSGASAIDVARCNSLAKSAATSEDTYITLIYALIFFSVLGAIVVAIRSSKNKNEEIQFEHQKDLSNDAYIIFLTKKYDITKNDALNKIICKDKLFDSIDEALNYADTCEIGNDNFIKPKKLKIKKEQPENVNATCPNCNSLVSMSDLDCWNCDVSFSQQSTFKPIPKIN